MHRIDTPSATSNNLFTDGSPTGGVPATVVDSSWLNDLQENIVAVITAAGVPLTKGRSSDLLDAIRGLAGEGLFNGGSAASDYLMIPFRDRSSGTRKSLIVQWGATPVLGPGIVTRVTFPIAFPEKIVYTPKFSEASQLPTATNLWQVAGVSLSGFDAATVGRISYNNGSPQLTMPVDGSMNWFALGF